PVSDAAAVPQGTPPFSFGKRRTTVRRTPDAGPARQDFAKYRNYRFGLPMPGQRLRSMTDPSMRAAAALLLVSLGGCTTIAATTPGGGVTGGEPAGKGNAAMVGGLITGDMAEGLGRQDIRKALEAEYRALEYATSGQSVTW